MAYLKSTQVKVYPSAYRGVNDKGELFNPEAQLNTEFNITNLQATSPNRSYVITAYRGTNTPLRCVIRGYYFELTLDDTTLAQFEKSTEVSNVYASIVVKAANNVDDTNTNYAAYTLVPYTQTTIGVPTSSLDEKQGDDYVFTGLMLTNEPPTDATDSLLILQKQVGDDRWRVPSTSRGRFSSNQILDSVKGETIDDSFTTKNLEVKENATIVGTLEVDDSTTLKGTLTVAGPTTLESSLELTQGGIISKGDINISQGALTADGLTITEDGSINNLESETITTMVIYPQGSNTEIGRGQNDGDRFDKIYGKDIYATTFHGDVPDLRENVTDIRSSLGPSQNAIALTNQSVLIDVLVNDSRNSVYTFHLILEDNLHKLGSEQSGYTTTLIDFGQLCWGIRNLSVDYRVQATAKLSDLTSTNPKTYDYIIEIHGEDTENPNTVNLYVDVYWYDSNATRWKRLESGNLYVSTTCRIIHQQ